MIGEQFQKRACVLVYGRSSGIRAHKAIEERRESRDISIDKIVDELLRFLGSSHGIPLQSMSECKDGKVEYEGVGQLLGRWRFQTAQLKKARGHLKYDVQEFVEQFLGDRFMLAKNSHFFRGKILAELLKIFSKITGALHHFGKLLRSALASSLHDIFLIAAGVAALAVVLSVFLQEVPIRGRTPRVRQPEVETAPAFGG